MMCDKCYHRAVCQNYLTAIFADRIKNPQAVKCPLFKDKDLVAELPCKIGGTLYMIADRVDGKSHIRRLTLTNQNMGNVLSRLGRDIYATREAAEIAMEVIK